jgi:ATP-dependent helicase/nuclease subunit B
MVTIVREALETGGASPERWAGIAARAAAWAQAAPLELRDAVVLLPFIELLPHAREAFMARRGWMPRIETTRTLAAALGPAPPNEAGQVSLDADVDALVATEMLRGQPWGAAWARRDARSFARAVAMVVESAHALVRASAAWPAGERAQRWAAARELLKVTAGPGGTERMLARVALEWACLASPPATDRLFALRPSAFIVVQAGGADPLSFALLASTTVPCLVIDTDASPATPFAHVRHVDPPAVRVCDSLEDEAQCAAAQVLEHLRHAEWPVALIAQDRQLVRRVRALLERQQISLRDETGWTLSTTRAAAQLMALLRAARPDATTDDLLDWLKGGSTWLDIAEASAVGALEHVCRKSQALRVAGLRRLALAGRLEGPAVRLWAAVDALLAHFTGRARAPLTVWVTTLAEALRRCGALPAMSADDAGRQVLATLRLPVAGAAPITWPPAAGAAVMSLDEFSAWVADTLEGASFVPARGMGAEPEQVVITPLARAMLRPFAAVVFPGADDAHLGGAANRAGLISDAQALALGIPTAADQRHAQLLAFVQCLHAPRITFFRRRVDGTEPMAASPLVERLSLALASRGEALREWHDPRVDVEVTPAPICMTAPSAPALLPQQVSASAVEALRACPYRFFALRMLGLREADELDGEIEKRDYGDWLHAVLLAFHTAREVPCAVADDVLQLHALADQVQLQKGLADADFLPFSASFAGFVPRYVAWLHERDTEGARFLRGEDDITLALPALGGVALHGVIDRIDQVRAERGAALQLIDYKTGSAASLRDKVRVPFEDTQLAFYAALVGAQTTQPLSAMYLALDGNARIEEVPHKGVTETADALLQGLAHDLQRLAAGAGLPALGEGRTCEFCEVRGVCRRDHWSPAEASA